MKRLYISSLIPKSTLSILETMGFVIFPLPPCKTLPSPTSTHADMILFYDGELILSEDYYTANTTLFDKVVLTTEHSSPSYPGDILFNCFVLNNTLFGKLENLSLKIKERYDKQIDLKQGYAKCSCIVLDDAIITADENIFGAVSKTTADALKISAGHICLPGYDCGFIGGSSLVFDNTVFFFGDITSHPDHEKIKEFLSVHGYNLAFDKSYPLTDFGGGIIA